MALRAVSMPAIGRPAGSSSPTCARTDARARPCRPRIARIKRNFPVCATVANWLWQGVALSALHDQSLVFLTSLIFRVFQQYRPKAEIRLRVLDLLNRLGGLVDLVAVMILRLRI
jgi:hypothetical protein